jgi:hypothetical protein
LDTLTRTVAAQTDPTSENAVCVVEKVPACEPDRAVEKARTIAEKDFQMLVFFKQHAWVWPGRAPSISIGDFGMAIGRSGKPDLILGQRDLPCILTPRGLERLQRAWSQWEGPLRKLLSGRQDTKFKKTLRKALQVIVKADNDKDNVDAFLGYVTALEQLLITREESKGDVGARSQLDRALMLLFGAEPGLGKDLYENRSKIAHGDIIPIDDNQLVEAWRYAREAFYYLLEHQNEIKSKKDVANHINLLESLLRTVGSGAKVEAQHERVHQALQRLKDIRLLTEDDGTHLTESGEKVLNHLQ